MHVLLGTAANSKPDQWYTRNAVNVVQRTRLIRLLESAFIQEHWLEQILSHAVSDAVLWQHLVRCYYVPDGFVESHHEARDASLRIVVTCWRARAGRRVPVVWRVVSMETGRQLGKHLPADYEAVLPEHLHGRFGARTWRSTTMGRRCTENCRRYDDQLLLTLTSSGQFELSTRRRRSKHLVGYLNLSDNERDLFGIRCYYKGWWTCATAHGTLCYSGFVERHSSLL